MSDFTKKFLLEDPRRLSPTGRYVGLAAFGKHPGWDDHVEDLGLETESLNFAKTVLYVNGIGGQIDSGAWEKLDAAQQFPTFKHVFVWQRSGQILVGRLWSSSDGKGRKRYPLVVCLQFVGVTLGWALKQALPALAELEEGCVKATKAEEVRGLLDRKRTALREILASTDGRGEYAPVTPAALHRILQPAGAAKPEGFLRVLYQMQSQLGAFSPGVSGARAGAGQQRAQQIRVPSAGESPEETLLFWTRFFQTQVDATVPLLLTVPLQAGWVDLTVGDPESHEFFCLRATPKAVPLVSEVPYTLDDEFRAKAQAFLDQFERGETKTVELKSAPAVAAETTTPARGSLFKWLGLGVVLVIGAVAAVLLLPNGGGDNATKQGANVEPSSGASAVRSETAPANDSAKGGTMKAEPAKDGAAKAAADSDRARMAAEAEAARLAAEKKENEAMAAAAKLKSEMEAIALQKEIQMADAARMAKEAEAARAKEAARLKELAELAEQKRKAAAQVKAAEEQKKAEEEKLRLAAASSAAKVTAAIPVSTPTARDTAVREEMTNSIGMVLVPLPSGMWVGKYEITQFEYQKVMGANPSKSVNDHQPVERVTWNDAVDFCRKLNELEQGKLPAGRVYKLPTEEQWKNYLGGQRFEDLPGGGLTGGGAPAVVGRSGPANKFGLYDVLGNVWEWCQDDSTSGTKVLKGGAFNSTSDIKTMLPDKAALNCGFRCIMAAP